MTPISNVTMTFLCLFAVTYSINSYLIPAELEANAPSGLWNRSEQVTVIASKTIRSNSLYHVLLILANSSQPANFDLKLTGRETLSKTVLIKPNQSQSVAFSINDWSYETSVLSVNASALNNSWKFAQHKQLSYEPKSISVFIQTDKAIYKPGQNVLFRALFLESSYLLKPVQLDEKLTIQVSDAQGNLIKQWKDPSTTQGLASFDFVLSEEPVLGDWCISVVYGQQEVKKEFVVAEHLPAPFDIQLKVPAQISYDATQDITNVIATVRSSYSYGKPVKGQVTLVVQQPEDVADKLNYSSFCSDTIEDLNKFTFYATLVDGAAEFYVPFLKPPFLMNEELTVQNTACQFELVASVEEEETGRMYNMSHRIITHASDIKIDWLTNESDKMPSFKPGLNYTTVLRLVHQDGSPVLSEVDVLPHVLQVDYLIHDKLVETVNLRQVGLGIYEHVWKVPALIEDSESGDFVVPQSMGIRVRHGTFSETKQLPRSCSASNRFMQISITKRFLHKKKKRQINPKALPVEVGDEIRVRIDASHPLNSLIFCHGMAHGDIVWNHNIDGSNKTSLEFDVRLSFNMAPNVEVICFYTNPDNMELIADSLKIPVSVSTKNFAQVSLNRDEAQPGHLVEVSVQTKPESMIGLLAIDHSVSLLKSGNDLTKEQVEKARLGSSDSNHQSYDVFHSTVESLFGLSGSVLMTTNMMQSEKVYQKVITTSSKMVELTPEEFYELMKKPLDSDCDEMMAEESEIVEAKQDFIPEREPSKPSKFVIRQFFSDTWIWTNGTADLEGRFKNSFIVPEPMTSYSLSAFSTSNIYGFALSTQHPSLKVSKPLFMKIHAPQSMIKGETVNVMATVINYSEDPISTKVTFYNKHRDFDFVKATINPSEDKYLRMDQQVRKVIVASQSSKTVSFLITPNKLNNIELELSIASDSSYERMMHKLQVKPEGKTQHRNQAVLINLKQDDKSKLVKNFTIKIPKNTVEGSEKVFVSIGGDMLSSSLKNVKNLLRIPYGNGESNMINLVPNVHILNYLEAIGRMNSATRSSIIRNIEKGYQRQLKYKRSDGSFSAFGESDVSGSVWLTAYVLKSLQQAKGIIQVDARILTAATEYIKKFFEVDGSIREVGMLPNQLLRSDEHPFYLTAYCMIPLIQAQTSVPNFELNEIEGKQEELIDLSLNYLESQLDDVISSGDTYDLALISYVLHIANRTGATERAHEELWKRASKSKGIIWWESKRLQSGTSKKNSTDEPSSLSIETTAYSLLTLVKRGELELASSVANWLISNQNSNGGFISTQDTVLALEALSSFATANAVYTGPQNLSFKLTYSTNIHRESLAKVEQYQITLESALMMHNIQLPTETKWVQVEVSGSGSGIVQVSSQYNLLEPRIDKPAFGLRADLNIDVSQNSLSLEACSHYKLGEASNIAVMDVKLPSGYTADVELMSKLQAGVEQVKKVEFFGSNSRIEIYFDKLTSDEVCVPVSAYRTWKISNNKPGSIGVYDYYDRRNTARITYGSKISSSCDICEAETCSRRCRRWKKSTG